MNQFAEEEMKKKQESSDDNEKNTEDTSPSVSNSFQELVISSLAEVAGALCEIEANKLSVPLYILSAVLARSSISSQNEIIKCFERAAKNYKALDLHWWGLDSILDGLFGSVNTTADIPQQYIYQIEEKKLYSIIYDCLRQALILGRKSCSLIS
jgi:hypothetical protein